MTILSTRDRRAGVGPGIGTGRLRVAVLVLAAVAALLSACTTRPSAKPADLVLVNASVYTMDAARPRAEAVAVSGDKIVYVGDAAGARRFVGPATRTADLAGRMLLPGFQDSHIHLISGGIELGLCNLSDLGTREAVFAAIKDYAARHPEKPWITGGGWALPLFPRANPVKADLDRLVPDRPVCLDAADGHSAWVNSRALAIAGVTRDTPDPAGGRIEREPGTGEPSGTLRESAARLVEKFVPELTAEDYNAGLRAGLDMARRFGITSIIEASAHEKTMEAYAAMDRSGDLTLRVLASLYVDPALGPAEVDRIDAMRRTYLTANLKASTAKIFVDGVMESHTAALLEPYLDRPGDRGKPLVEPEALDRLATALDAAGFQIHIHAIGDLAIRMSLDAFESAARANGVKDLRHHIAHLELIDPADIPRFRVLGAVANFQPLWAYEDDYIKDLTLPILGPARSRWLYPIGSVLRTGAVVAGGSDWSVSSANPLDAIEVAVTRRAPGAPEGPAWIPEETASLQAMLAAYTTNGAYLSHEEKVRGTIAAGRIADLVVLDRDLFRIPAREIHAAKVLLTLFAGREVFRDARLGPSF